MHIDQLMSMASHNSWRYRHITGGDELSRRRAPLENHTQVRVVPSMKRKLKDAKESAGTA